MQTSATMRERLFTIRMTDEERERAERLATHHGLNVAGLIRMLLKQEERRLLKTGGLEQLVERAATAAYDAAHGKKPTKRTRAKGV